jgi:magnesium chelatase family protein
MPAGGGLIERRPFRMPHHTASDVSITGGGRNPIPGEITLAHNGILYMDEFPEFRSSIIQALRQPLEHGRITVARAESRLSYPARFMLVASMNPCPCGYLFDTERACRCSQRNINKYFMKLSGPILDRIDIQVVVKPLKAFEIIDGKPAHSSESIRARVVEAQNRQHARYRDHGEFLNASMDLDLIKRYCVVGKGVRNLLFEAVQRMRLTARSYYRILRVARTVADLAGRERLSEEDILEVLCFREVERILYGDTTVGAASPGPELNG